MRSNPSRFLLGTPETDSDKTYEVLATTNGEKDPVVGLRKHGEGAYIVTSMRDDSQSTVTVNKKELMENLLDYAFNWLHQK